MEPGPCTSIRAVLPWYEQSCLDLLQYHLNQAFLKEVSCEHGARSMHFYTSIPALIRAVLFRFVIVPFESSNFKRSFMRAWRRSMHFYTSTPALIRAVLFRFVIVPLESNIFKRSFMRAWSPVHSLLYEQSCPDTSSLVQICYSTM